MKPALICMVLLAPLLAQTSLPPASLDELKQAAIVTYRVPDLLPEPKALGHSANLLRPKAVEQQLLELGNNKIINTEASDLHVLVGARGLKAMFYTRTFERKSWRRTGQIFRRLHAH